VIGRRKGRGAIARLIGSLRGNRLAGGQRGERASRRGQRNLIGRDLAPLARHAERRRRLLPVALIGTLLAALCLAALRIDLIRQRYELAAAMREEKQLVEERRLLTAQVRGLRDPARLADLAKELGFERPERVIEIAAPGVPAGSRP